MPLNFNFSEVANYEEVTIHPTDSTMWHPVADALVWLSLQCGFNEITPKNVNKVIDRIMAYQVVVGAYLGPNGGNIYIMPVDIRRFVGMRTNATRLTDAQWHRRLGKVAEEVGTWLARRLEREQRRSALAEIAHLAEQAKPQAA